MAEAGGGAAVWSGAGLTQEELMHKDECIVVDDTDCVVGHQSKAACHRFLPAQPQGILHRAFSVFLFNPQGELLLQQRAAAVHSARPMVLVGSPQFSIHLVSLMFPGIWPQRDPG